RLWRRVRSRGQRPGDLRHRLGPAAHRELRPDLRGCGPGLPRGARRHPRDLTASRTGAKIGGPEGDRSTIDFASWLVSRALRSHDAGIACHHVAETRSYATTDAIPPRSHALSATSEMPTFRRRSMAG